MRGLPRLLGSVCVWLSGLVTLHAAAAVETCRGVDRGVGESVRLSSHPLADAARVSFLARLAAGVGAETFEGVAVTPPAYAIRSIDLTFAGTGAGVLEGSGLVMSSPAPSTANPINGIASGVYPISGTRAWLSADDFELRFQQPQVALGFYGVDIGDFTGQLVLDLVHTDASTTRVVASDSGVVPGGGVLYIGLLSIDRPFVAVRFGNTVPVGYDGFAFDDLTIATAAQLAPVPEPASVALMLAGLGWLGVVGARRCQRTAG